MGSPISCSNCLIFLSALFMFLLLCSNPVHAVTPIALARVCSQTKNPTFCVDTLNADPRTGYADLFQLVTVSSNLAIVNGTNSLNYIDSQISSGTDIDQRPHFQFCRDKYLESLTTVKKALESFGYGDYQAVCDYCDSAFLGPKECEDTFNSPPVIRSPFTANNENFAYLIDMISSFTRQLP